jgi:hypothetical protein
MPGEIANRKEARFYLREVGRGWPGGLRPVKPGHDGVSWNYCNVNTCWWCHFGGVIRVAEPTRTQWSLPSRLVDQQVATSMFVTLAFKGSSWPGGVLRWVGSFGGMLKSAATEREVFEVLQRPRIAQDAKSPDPTGWTPVSRYAFLISAILLSAFHNNRGGWDDVH